RSLFLFCVPPCPSRLSLFSYTTLFRSGAAPADFLFGEERTAADGTAAVQLAVSVVCGDGDGRGGVEPRGVQQESGAAAERGDRRGVFPAGARAGAAVFVGRAFHGGRDADRSVGEPEEFSAEGRPGGPARCERRGRLSRREAAKPNAPVHDRSRGAVI